MEETSGVLNSKKLDEYRIVPHQQRYRFEVPLKARLLTYNHSILTVYIFQKAGRASSNQVEIHLRS